MLLLDITIVVVALPAIQHDLGGGFSQIQWTIDAYALALAALQLPTGSLADHYGRTPPVVRIGPLKGGRGGPC